MVSFRFFFLLAIFFCTATIFGSLLPLETIYYELNLEAKDSGLSLGTWVEKAGSYYTVRDTYYVSGFMHNNILYGLVLSKLHNPSDTTVLSIKREISNTLASRSITLPFIKDTFNASSLPDTLLDEFITYQIFYGVEFRINRLVFMKYIFIDNWVGYIYLVDIDNLTIISIPDELQFAKSILRDPRNFADNTEVNVAIDAFNFIVANKDLLGVPNDFLYVLYLYLSALYLNYDEYDTSFMYLSLLPDNIALILRSRFFGEKDFLLLGDMYMIHNNEQKAFSAWAYGMQKYPLNAELESRFIKYDR